eukprot:5475190-Amphidinium_carterae.1
MPLPWSIHLTQPTTHEAYNATQLCNIFCSMQALSAALNGVPKICPKPEVHMQRYQCQAAGLGKPECFYPNHTQGPSQLHQQCLSILRAGRGMETWNGRMAYRPQHHHHAEEPRTKPAFPKVAKKSEDLTVFLKKFEHETIAIKRAMTTR